MNGTRSASVKCLKVSLAVSRVTKSILGIGPSLPLSLIVQFVWPTQSKAHRQTSTPAQQYRQAIRRQQRYRQDGYRKPLTSLHIKKQLQQVTWNRPMIWPALSFQVTIALGVGSRSTWHCLRLK